MASEDLLWPNARTAENATQSSFTCALSAEVWPPLRATGKFCELQTRFVVLVLVNQQFGHVLRRLGRSPMFAAVSLLTIAIGVGANSVIFSVVNGVLLKPLPYPDAE